MWVRGLKLRLRKIFERVLASHPVWVRGLKRCRTDHCQWCRAVAPRVGAWIETQRLRLLERLSSVAPRVGAWIETAVSLDNNARYTPSHPVWVRGLKQLGADKRAEGSYRRTPCGCVD